MTILATITRQQEAIGLLLKSGYPSEAATICLSQFELKLDILFIGSDVKKATQWVDHEREHKHPWPTKNKIEHVYGKETEESSRQQHLFTFLSAIKHGNPTAGGFGFNVRGTEKGFTVTTTTVNDDFSKLFSCVLSAYSTHQLIDSVTAYRDLVKLYFGSPPEHDKALSAVQKESQANMDTILQMIEDYEVQD